MAVRVGRTSGLALGRPEPAVDAATPICVVGAGGMTLNPAWIPNADGGRFIAVTSDTNEVTRPLTVLLNWATLLREESER